MYGRYTKDLGEYAKNEARKLKMLERRRKKEDKARNRVSMAGSIGKKPMIYQLSLDSKNIDCFDWHRNCMENVRVDLLGFCCIYGRIHSLDLGNFLLEF